MLQRDIEDEVCEMQEIFQDNLAMVFQLFVHFYHTLIKLYQGSRQDLRLKESRPGKNYFISEFVFSNIFDEDQVRSKLVDYYFTRHRLPGESYLIPELHHSNPITQQCPTSEQLRRDDINRTKIYVRVLVNNYQVSQTKDWYVTCR